MEGWLLGWPSFFMMTANSFFSQAILRQPWLLILLAMFFIGCNTQETAKPILYEGPLSEGEDITMHYSEKDIVKVMLKAKKIFEFQNGDREFPEGIYMEFYDEFGKLNSTLQANSAYFFKEENKWRGRGKVEVINTAKQEQLNTEELFWKPDTKKIFTDKFVTIKLQNEVIYGTGLDAAQDLSTYQIKNPEGEFVVED
jgi:LPS export ABC transporter protein LptC